MQEKPLTGERVVVGSGSLSKVLATVLLGSSWITNKRAGRMTTRYIWCQWMHLRWACLIACLAVAPPCRTINDGAPPPLHPCTRIARGDAAASGTPLALRLRGGMPLPHYVPRPTGDSDDASHSNEEEYKKLAAEYYRQLEQNAVDAKKRYPVAAYSMVSSLSCLLQDC